MQSSLSSIRVAKVTGGAPNKLSNTFELKIYFFSSDFVFLWINELIFFCGFGVLAAWLGG
jgi:hypothetical protein